MARDEQYLGVPERYVGFEARYLGVLERHLSLEARYLGVRSRKRAAVTWALRTPAGHLAT